jgi:hypothetical protein
VHPTGNGSPTPLLQDSPNSMHKKPAPPTNLASIRCVTLIPPASRPAVGPYINRRAQISLLIQTTSSGRSHTELLRLNCLSGKNLQSRRTRKIEKCCSPDKTRLPAGRCFRGRTVSVSGQRDNLVLCKLQAIVVWGGAKRRAYKPCAKPRRCPFLGEI